MVRPPMLPKGTEGCPGGMDTGHWLLREPMPRHPTPEPLGNGAMGHQGTDSHYFAPKTSQNPICLPRCLSISLGPPRSPSVPLGPPRSLSVSLAVQIETRWSFSGVAPSSCCRSVWQAVSTDSLKFHLGPPCPTLIRPAGGPPPKL
jgi:hypothetical protein